VKHEGWSVMFQCISVYVHVYICLSVSDRFDKELAALVSEMKKGGVLEVRKKPIPPFTSLASIDSQQWHGLNTSFLHTHYPGLSD